MRQDAPTVARGEGKCTDIPALITDDRAAGGRNPFQTKAPDPIRACSNPSRPSSVAPPSAHGDAQGPGGAGDATGRDMGGLEFVGLQHLDRGNELAISIEVQLFDDGPFRSGSAG